MPRKLELQIEVEIESDADLFRDKVAALLTEHAEWLRSPDNDLPAAGSRDHPSGTIEWYAKIDAPQGG